MENKYTKNLIITRITIFNPQTAKAILKIRNEKEIRKNMINSKIIKIGDHYNWLKKIIKNKKVFFYKVYIKKILSGVLKFEIIEPKTIEWSFYLNQKNQKLYGAFLEYLAICKMFKKKNIRKIICQVFSFNTRVISMHQKFGFVINNPKKIKKNKNNLIHFSISKNRWGSHLPLIKKKIRV